jgi:multidrug efflux pump subunit AcrB
MSDKRLNAAGRIAAAFVSSKLTTLFMLAALLVGALAVLTTPREENPQIDVPGATVQVLLPGSSPAEVEEQVVRPLEGIIKQINGVDHVYAAAVPSGALLTVQFKVGEDKERSLVKLYDRVLGARDLLPAAAVGPTIRSADADDVPVVTVTLASERLDDEALKRVAERMVDGLRSVPSASTIFIKGGRDRELRVEVDPLRLQSFGITLDQLRLLVAASDVAAPLGTQVHGGQNRSITFDGFIRSARELEDVVVGGLPQRPIHLRDVARIVDGPAVERHRLARFGYGPADARFGTLADAEVPAVTIAVAKKRGDNAVAFADDVLARVEAMRGSLVPRDVEVLVTRNDGQKADHAVNNLIEHLLVAVGAVCIVSALFLGLKEALIVGITVPLILALTLGVVQLFGLTMNRVTLFALILALGLLVDAAIVVIENIHRRYARHDGLDQAQRSVSAANEIGNPTNLATLAVMVVFASIVPALTGMPRPYFFPIGFVVPVAMAVSLLVAYAVVPWAANRWLKMHESESEGGHGAESWMVRRYRAAVTALAGRARLRRWALLVIAALMALALLQPTWQFLRPGDGSTPPLGVAVGFLPKDNKNTFNVTLELPVTAPLEVTDAAAREVGVLLRATPEVANYQTWVGEAGVPDFNGMLRGALGKTGPHVAEVRVNLADRVQRDRSSIDIARELRARLAVLAQRYPGATLQVAEDPPGPPVRATILAEIYGRDLAQMRRASELVEGEFRKTFDMVEVTRSEPVDLPRHRLVVDREKAALAGITEAEVGLALRRLIDGEELAVAHVPGARVPVPIRLTTPRRHEVDTAMLQSVKVTNRAGVQLPLVDLVRVSADVEDRPILHKDGERVSYVGGELGSTVPVYAVIDLDRRLRGVALPDGTRLATGNAGLRAETPQTLDGVRLLWDGELRMTIDAYRDMGIALLGAVTLVFLILVAYYQSFVLALVAMASIPLCVVGIFPGHWLLGAPFSGTSMIGLIALAGVVVRNSLLIVDFVLATCARA